MSTHSSYELLVVTLLAVSEREECVVALHLPTGPLKARSVLELYRDANPVPTSSLFDDIATGIFQIKTPLLDSHHMCVVICECIQDLYALKYRQVWLKVYHVNTLTLTTRTKEEEGLIYVCRLRC